MDNSGTKKEGVSRTYKGYDGYVPIAAYLGREGWAIVMELREGNWHAQKEFNYVLDRMLPRACKLVGSEQKILGSSAELVGKAPFPGDVLGGSTTHELVVQEEPCGLVDESTGFFPDNQLINCTTALIPKSCNQMKQ